MINLVLGFQFFFWLNCRPKLASFTLTFLGKNLLKLPVYYIVFYILEKRSVLLTAIILFSLTVSAQQQKVDSLQSLVNNTVGVYRYDPLVALTRAYSVIDNNKALDFAKEARAIAYQVGDTVKIVTSSRMVAQLFNRLDRGKESEGILLEVVSVAKRNNIRDEYKNILNHLAISYTVQAKYDKALDYNFQTLVLREQDNDVDQINISLNNIGLVYFKLKNYSRALEYYSQSLKLLENAKNKYFLDRLLVNIGLCYNQLEDYEEAEKYFDRGFKVCGEKCSEQTKIEGQFGLGVSHYKRRDFPEAIGHFSESYSIAKRLGNERFQAENLIYLARVYIAQSQLDSGLVAVNKCEQLALKGGYTELLVDSYRESSHLFNQKQDFEKASYYQGKYIELKDSILSGTIIDRMAKIQTNYAERENLKTIADKEEVIQRQRSLNIAIVIIAVLASLLIFVLYRSIQVKKKVNQALSDAKAIIEDQNKQLLNSNFSLDRELKERNIELSKANESLQRVNEELDNFIYKTSHDIRGPLASLKGMCNVALMDVKDQLALNYLKKLDITAEKLNTILTRLLIVNQINASALGSEKIDFGGLVSDVLILERKKGLPQRIKIKKNIDLDIVYYSDREFVRIILENLIDNAIKFYNDSERVEPFVEISVIEEDHHVKIMVVDNGIGISQVHPDKIFQMFSRASERSETGGIGLYITKTATEKLGGEVNLKTTPEGYTEFFVLLPLSTVKVLA